MQTLCLSDSESRAAESGRLTLAVRPIRDDGEEDGWCRDRRGRWYEVEESEASDCPWQPGDVLAGREAWSRRLDVDPAEDPEKARQYVLYRADGEGQFDDAWHPYMSQWRPASAMPRWAVRHWLRVVAVMPPCRVRQLSHKEMEATGCKLFGCQGFVGQWDRRFRRYPWESAWCWRVKVERSERP